ncbi:MAG: alpha-glucosidase/alpha-galactosidase [Zestosphaera sp.]
MERLKVAFIGAGSAVWSNSIVRDILIKEELRNAVDIWLMDVSPWRLDVIYNFSRRYAEELGVKAGVYRTADIREAVKDADFVVNSAMAGGHDYYELMREVSERHGYYRGVNSVEWNYVSDYHTIWGYYQFKLFTEILRNVEELAPDAWLINVANPVFELTTLAGRVSKVRTVGLCHGHLGYLRSAVLALGMRLARKRLAVNVVPECGAGDLKCYATVAGLIDWRELEVEIAGFNHLVWLTKFKYEGEDAYEYLGDWVREDSEAYWRAWRESVDDPFEVDLAPAAIDMYITYGLLPVGDAVRAGTWKYHWDLKTKQYWYGPYGGPDSEVGWAMYTADLKRRLRELAVNVLDWSTPLTRRYPPVTSGESVVEIIEAIATGVPKDHYHLHIPVPGAPPIPVPIQVNTLNKDVMFGVPSDVTVEVPAVVDGKGVHGKPVTTLPTKIMKYAMMPRLMRAEWALEAFRTGGRDHLLNWLIVDVRTKSTKQVEEAIDALLKLPGNEEMAKHFS